MENHVHRQPANSSIPIPERVNTLEIEMKSGGQFTGSPNPCYGSVSEVAPPGWDALPREGAGCVGSFRCELRSLGVGPRYLALFR